MNLEDKKKALIETRESAQRTLEKYEKVYREIEHANVYKENLENFLHSLDLWIQQIDDELGHLV